jgi:hypothetical protein
MRLLLAVVLAGLGSVTVACSDDDAGDDAAGPVIVERTDQAPAGEAGRDGCEPTTRSFAADANGRFESPDEAFLAGVSEYEIPGESVVAVSQGPSSAHYYSYDGEDLRAITGVSRTSNGLWGVSGARFCE